MQDTGSGPAGHSLAGCLLGLVLAGTSPAAAERRAQPPQPGSPPLTAEQVRAIWDDAQGYAGVMALEPETALIGGRAAQKKTWSLADKLLRFFVYGKQPNWFPMDSVRRTTCAQGVGWSYFWHEASGRERDLHAWVEGGPAFSQLLGDEGAAAILKPVLDLSLCKEVKGKDDPCLYSEVTLRQQGFERWFCGGPKHPCLVNLTLRPNSVPPDFAGAAQTCMHGPWVLERVHNWRPEMHPAEVQWVRPEKHVNRWLFLLLPDGSGRFDKAKHFDEKTAPSPGWRPWSTDRPVELWVAFEEPRGSGAYVFDLAVKSFGKKAEAARQAPLELPEPGAEMRPLSEPFPELEVSGSRWVDESCQCNRGILVVRSRIQKGAKRTLALRLSGRRADEAPPEVEIRERRALVGAPDAKTLAQLRLFGIARQGASPRAGYVSVRTLVRFDPLRPPVHEDEEQAAMVNKALKGSAERRREVFGVERPFRVEWSLGARRNTDGSVVPISLSGQPPSDSHVGVVAWRGKATSQILVNGRALVGRVEDSAVSLGDLWVAVPAGVTLKGTARIVYEGTKDLRLLDLSKRPGNEGTSSFQATVALRLPARRYGNTQEWELVRDVLAETDAATAAARLADLQEKACWPARQCQGGVPPPALSDALAHPVRRWETLRALSAEGRPAARFVQHFAHALVWDDDVGEEERELLARLLTRTEATAGPSR